MKRFATVPIVSCFLCVSLWGAHAADSSPSQNPSLNAITPSGKIEAEHKGYLQRSYERWEKDEWEPLTEPENAAKPEAETKTPPATAAEPKNEVPKPEAPSVTAAEPETTTPEPAPKAAVEPSTEPEKKTETTSDSSGRFTIQHYYDKWDRYLDEKEKRRTKPLLSEELETMPGIGQPKGR